ncbi:2956_t:CDS:2 [Entrophospora sp. SA101]|nr:2956_t:CDS:2 [Entrophospora sp. SA101]
MPGLKSPNEKKPKSRSCNLKKVIAKHSRTKCCCCIPIKPGVMTIAILLLIHALWHTAMMIPEIKIYITHLPRAFTIVLSILYFLVAIIAIYGINALRMNDKNKVKIFSIIYWLSVVLLLVLHLVQLILAFKWKDDTMYNCQDDIRYWVPSNSSTVTMPDDPNATTIQEVGDACEAATKLALIFYLVDYFLKFIFLIHFGRVVHSYSKVLFEEKIDNGEDLRSPLNDVKFNEFDKESKEVVLIRIRHR